ncbi:MAG: acyl carrier protein [Nanoarchaeota archaeon]
MNSNTQITQHRISDVVPTIRNIIYERLQEGDSKISLDNIQEELTLDELGLDSLTMQEIVFQIEDEYGVTIKMDEVYRRESIHELKPTLRSFGDYVFLQLNIPLVAA